MTDVIDLLHVLQSPFPVAALVPAKVVPHLQSVVDSWSNPSACESDIAKLTVHLRHAITFIKRRDPGCMDVLGALLKEILLLAKHPSQEVFNEIPLQTDYRGVQEFFYSGHWYPKNPLLRKVPLYSACRGLKSNTALKRFTRGHNITTPGLFLVFCDEHDELIGFHLLKYYESTRTVHDLILSRFEGAPSIVIYDHACDLHKYSMQREPKFFAETQFVVDKLHYGGHEDCSSAYDPYKYKELDDVNTTIYEQVNSQIKHTRRSLQKMTQEHFLFMLRHILYMLKCIKDNKKTTWSEVLRGRTTNPTQYESKT